MSKPETQVDERELEEEVRARQHMQKWIEGMDFGRRSVRSDAGLMDSDALRKQTEAGLITASQRQINELEQQLKQMNKEKERWVAASAAKGSGLPPAGIS